MAAERTALMATETGCQVIERFSRNAALVLPDSQIKELAVRMLALEERSAGDIVRLTHPPTSATAA